jgi:hypothetical protein
MNRLREADAKYRAAETPRIDRIQVADPAVETCCAAASALVRMIDDAERPPAWASVRNAATALRWSVLTRPRLPSAGPDDVGAQLAVLRSEQRRLSAADPAALTELQTAVDAANSLAAASGDELAEQIVTGIRGDSGTGCVVLVNAAARRSAEAALGGRLPSTVFLTPRQFIGGGLWNRAVVVGLSAWYPDATFTAPRAQKTALVHHRWLRDQAAVPGIFDGAAAYPLSLALPQQCPDRLIPDIVRPPVKELDWGSIEPVGGQPRDNDPSDDVPARLVLLAGGFGFYLEADADRIRGLDPLQASGRWIRQLPVAGLGPDTVVVLRRAGSERELLQPRINTLLADDQHQVRSRQAEWKNLLSERLRRGGLRDLRRAVSMPDLTLQYARYWAGSVSICPRSSTFSKLLQYLQVSDPQACSEAARKLFNAHLGAGRQLSKDLEALVDDSVVNRLESSDSVTLSLDTGTGATQITLFRVIAVCPNTVTIPAAALRSPLRMKGTKWLG